MKKSFLFVSLFGLMWVVTIAMINPRITSAATQQTKRLAGRWQHTRATGEVWVWSIRANGTFSVSSKGKAFANGQYRVQNGIYDVNDPNCSNTYHGRYQFAFFAKDSLRFTVLEDTCRPRRSGMDGTGWKHLPDAE